MSNSFRPSSGLLIHACRAFTGRMRLLPDFLIVGAQKCGTTFLYNLLKQHPCVMPAVTKEIHYFDLNFAKGEVWYRTHFPLSASRALKEKWRKQRVLTGESSPYYLYHPHALRRIAELIPNAKLILLLRNPVDRAYSHFYHEVKKQRETLSFTEAIAAEETRLEDEVKKMSQNVHYRSWNHQHYSYLHRGMYIDQIERLAAFFKRSQFLIVKSEDFYETPLKHLHDVLQFLELPAWEPANIRPLNVGTYPEMDGAVRRQLSRYFEPYNRRLCTFLGKDFHWQ